MVQVLRRAQAADEVVTVATIVASSLNLGKMSHLMKDSGSLVLSMASAGKGSETGEEQRTVDHLASGWGGVSQDTTGAGTENISAVVAGVSRGGRTALCGNVVEYTLDSGRSR